MELAVLIGGKVAGSLDLSGGQPSFEYAPAYVHGGGPPLSVGIPLSKAREEGVGLRWWLEGLLPDDTDTIRGLRRAHDLQGGDYLRVLGTSMGVDCAGAVQFCLPEKVEYLLSATGGEEPITEAGIAEWLPTAAATAPFAFTRRTSARRSDTGRTGNTRVMEDLPRRTSPASCGGLILLTPRRT